MGGRHPLPPGHLLVTAAPPVGRNGLRVCADLFGPQPAVTIARPPARAVRRADPAAAGRLRLPLRAPRARHLARGVRPHQGGTEWPLSRRTGCRSPPATGSPASSPTAST